MNMNYHKVTEQEAEDFGRCNKFFCWREVETEAGWKSQYLDEGGSITSDINSRAYFASEEEAQSHIEAHSESGEPDFVSQSAFVRAK